LYQPGDENYNLSELVSASLTEYSGMNSLGMRTSPNPFQEGGVSIMFDEPLDKNSKVYIYDAQGRLIQDLSNQIMATPKLLHWNGKSERQNDCSPGLYHISVNQNGKMFSSKLIKQ